jgi:hypothetical protein
VQVHVEQLIDLLGLAASKISAQLELHMGDPGERDAVRIMLEDSPCVWTGEGFVRAKFAVLNLDRDYRPYLHRVPDTQASCAQLMTLLGVSPGLSCCVHD